MSTRRRVLARVAQGQRAREVAGDVVVAHRGQQADARRLGARPGVLEDVADERALTGRVQVVGAGADRRLERGIAPAHERPDRRDEHVALIDERAHGCGVRDVGHARLEAAELGGERLQAGRVARGEHRGARHGARARARSDRRCTRSRRRGRCVRPWPEPILRRVDERVLAERLMAYDTSKPEGLAVAAEFVKGWLETRDIDVHGARPRRPAGRPRRGRAEDRAASWSCTATSTSSRRSRSSSRRASRATGCIGRGAYDMKGALAAMMCALHDATRPGPGPRDASSACPTRSPRTSTTARPTRSSRAAWSRTSRSPASRPTCTSASRPRASWRSASRSAASPRTARRRGWATTRSSRPMTSSGGSRRCRSAASPPICSTARRSTSRASPAATRSTRSRTAASSTSTSASSRARTPAAILDADPRDPGPRGRALLHAARRRSSRAATPTSSRCARPWPRSIEGEALSIGRDGASDAISFLEAGIPAVEFGPVGAGHHGPEEWVSIASLQRYRRALGTSSALPCGWSGAPADIADAIVACRPAGPAGASQAGRRAGDSRGSRVAARRRLIDHPALPADRGRYPGGLGSSPRSAQPAHPRARSHRT